MSDSLRTDRSRALDAAPDADRDAKIEQLLLVGLDHYFASQYDQAINVWTRALFLDRSHARARAYIERARSALAERQRESEELLHTGVAAFERGEGSEARRLLHAAIAGGAPSDQALAVLDRLDRLESAATDDRPPVVRHERQLMPRRDRGRTGAGTRVPLALSAVVVLAVSGYVVFAPESRQWPAWMPLQPAPASIVTGLPAGGVELPLPRRGASSLVRARALAASGRLRDALVALDDVRSTDPQKPDADRLRAEIQRQLLALSQPAGGAPVDPEGGDRRVP